MTDPRRQAAMDMRRQGVPLRAIADHFGVSQSTISLWTTPGAHERVLAQARAWKKANAGQCEVCGGPTNASRGKGTAAKVCAACLRWTADAVVEAFRDYFDDFGLPPTAQASRRGENGNKRLPHLRTTTRLFGSWNAALEAAGLPKVCDRDPSISRAMAEAVASGKTLEQVGDMFGCTGSNVLQRIRRLGHSVRDIRAAA